MDESRKNLLEPDHHQEEDGIWTQKSIQWDRDDSEIVGKSNDKAAIIKPKLSSTSAAADDDVVIIHSREFYSSLEHRRIMFNLLVLGFAFLLLFTGSLSMSILQSSVNKEGGLGTYSLVSMNASILLSSLFLPSAVIYKLTVKWTMFWSTSGYILYICAQFYPTFATLIPAGVLIGICSSCLWSAQSVYVTQIGEEYGYLMGQKTKNVLQRFFGIFFVFFSSAFIWGNVVSSTILAPADELQVDVQGKCGVHFCPAASTGTAGDGEDEGIEILQRPSNSKIYMLTTVFLGCLIAAALIILCFLDPLVRFGEMDRRAAKPPPQIMRQVKATISLWRNPYQLLLIPMTIMIGLEQGFLGVDFTAGYIGCTLGIHFIGYVFVCLGVCNAISSFVFGRVAAIIGRPTVFLLGVSIHVSTLILKIHWEPNPGQPVIIFLIGAFSGLADGMLMPQLQALYGLLFPKELEPAFSNNRLWMACGNIIAYVNGNMFCMRRKLYFMIIAFVVSTATYLVVEWRVGAQERLKEQQGTRNLASNNIS